MARARNNAVTGASGKTTVMDQTRVKNGPGKDITRSYTHQSE